MAHYLTTEGRDKLVKELEHLKTNARKEVTERLLIAKEHGDLKENAAYTQAKDDQATIENRIAELEHLLKNILVVDESSISHTKVGVGSSFTASFAGKKLDFKIVGPEEVDPTANKISYESPLGKAFMNREVGDVVSIKAPAGEFQYEIVEIK